MYEVALLPNCKKNILGLQVKRRLKQQNTLLIKENSELYCIDSPKASVANGQTDKRDAT